MQSLKVRAQGAKGTTLKRLRDITPEQDRRTRKEKGTTQGTSTSYNASGGLWLHGNSKYGKRETTNTSIQ